MGLFRDLTDDVWQKSMHVYGNRSLKTVNWFIHHINHLQKLTATNEGRNASVLHN